VIYYYVDCVVDGFDFVDVVVFELDVVFVFDDL